MFFKDLNKAKSRGCQQSCEGIEGKVKYESIFLKMRISCDVNKLKAVIDWRKIVFH